MNKLKLYVWEGVLCDYTCGMMVALAPNITQARKALRKKSEWTGKDLLTKPTMIVDVNDKTETIAFVVHGGA